MKFNLGDKVRIKSNGIIGIIISRGYNEYLDENDKQQSFEEYQIEADKFYQCNEDGIELVTIGQVLQSIYDIPPQIKINLDKIKERTSINEDNEKKLKNVKVEDDPVNSFMGEYERIVTDTMELCKKKNKDYGSSVQDTYQKFGDISYLTRITDKYNRICSLMSKDNEIKDESILDSIKDMGNYCFLWSASKSLDDR